MNPERTSQLTHTLTVEQIRDLDRVAVEKFGIPSIVLMENAGRSCVEVICTLIREPAARITIVCGKGNNGGDGFVIARHLEILGFRTQTCIFHPDSQFSEDAKTNLQILRKLSLTVTQYSYSDELDDLETTLKNSDLIIDALLGTGISGPLRVPDLGIIKAMNSSGVPVVAIDVPSGLNADSGTADPIAVLAQHTVTLAAFKPGLLTINGQKHCGVLHLGSIGIPDSILNSVKQAPPTPKKLQ